MTETISQRELRNDSGRIMRLLDEGYSFVVSRHGQPIGELRPLRRPHFVDAASVVAAMVGAPALDASRLLDDLDATVDQDVRPRA